jgi:hypothetical protein
MYAMVCRHSYGDKYFKPPRWLARFFESVSSFPLNRMVSNVYRFSKSRVHWLASFGRELGGPEKAEAMVKGQGVSLILKSMEIRFRRPVTYPDTVGCPRTLVFEGRVLRTWQQLLIGYMPIPPPSDDINDRSTLRVAGSAYSLAQEAFVAHCKEEVVWYDYDRLKKCDPGDRVREVVYGRIRAQ